MESRLLWMSVLLLSTVMIGLGIAGSVHAQQVDLTPQEQLGSFLFYDQNLSLNNNQACAACHGSEVSYTGPIEQVSLHGGVYEGSIAGNFGNRKPPTTAYAGDSPILHYDEEAGWFGGMFWDGRATGWTMGDPLAEQALLIPSKWPCAGCMNNLPGQELFLQKAFGK